MSLYQKYKEFTMIPESIFNANIELCKEYRDVPGCVVECGVWKGGMIAGIAEVLGNGRNYFLFDSFEGLPLCTEEDGKGADDWQKDTASPTYFNNCGADISFAEKAMAMSGVANKQIIKGWYSDTLPNFDFKEKIAILRLDSDWYNSTMDCLNNLYRKVAHGGIIIVDDYYIWPGCTRAIHEYLFKSNVRDTIMGTWPNFCYIKIGR
jgi:O-methyltransferase